jgi:competence protein ComEC
MSIVNPTLVSWPHQPMVRIVLLYAAGLLFAANQNGYLSTVPLTGVCLLLLIVLIIAQLVRSKVQIISLLKGIICSLLVFLLGILSAVIRAPESDVKYWFPQYTEQIQCIVEVLPEPILKKGIYRFNCELLSVRNELKFERVNGVFRCSLPDSLGLSPLTGDRILLNCLVQIPNKERLSGLFSMKNWLAGQGIEAELKPISCKLFDAENPSGLFRRFVINWRKRLIAVLEQNGLSGNELAVGSALILGERSEIDREVLTNYTSSGIVHILAVSGLHVGLIYAGLLLLIGRIKRFKNSFIGLLFCLSALWLYAFITGLSPSVLRASVMYSFIAFARLKKSPVSPFNALAASAFLLLCSDPWIYRNTGFQLSFAAVWGILSFAGLVDKISAFSQVKWIRYLCLSAGISCSAQLATLPITLNLFGSFPLYFLITNLIAIPVSTFLTYIGIASIIAGTVPYVGIWLTYLFGKGILFLNLIAEVMAKLPGAVMSNLYICQTEMVLGLLVIFQLALILRSFTIQRGALLMFLILLVSITGLVNSIQNRSLNQLLLFKRKDAVHVIYVQQGKAIHLHSKISHAELDKIQAELNMSLRATYGIAELESSTEMDFNCGSVVSKSVCVSGNSFIFYSDPKVYPKILSASKPIWLVVNQSNALPEVVLTNFHYAGIILFSNVTSKVSKLWKESAGKHDIPCFKVSAANYVTIDF